jgi:hypothetical protein
MIELIDRDEYGCGRLVASYETLDDARDALNELECALEDATSSARISKLNGLIEQLEQLIREHEEL